MLKKDFFQYIILYSTLFFVSCTMAPNLERPIINDTPNSFLNKTNVIIDSILSEKWWYELKDENLNAIVDSVIKNNLDLQIASQRVKQFEALFDIQSSQQYPTVVLNGGYNKRDGKMQLGVPLPSADENGFIDTKTEQYSLKTGLILNVDIWGKYRAMNKSANAAYKASKYDLQNAYNSLIAQTISLYYEILTLQKQIKLIEKSVESFRKGMELQKKRYERGTRTRLNLELSRQQYATSKIQYEQLQEAYKNIQYALAVLNGKYPKTINTTLLFPLKETLKEIPVGFPSNLVKRRSDINASFQRLESARYAVGVARADRFPQLTLSADLGFIGKDISDVFKFDFGALDKTYNAGIKQVIYSGGATSGKVDQSWAEFNIAQLNYRKTVLNAFQEVESTLVSLNSKQKQLIYSKEQKEASKITLNIMKKRYRSGISSYEELLNSERTFYNAETAYLTSQKNYIQSRINLYLSLGGKF